MGSPNVWILGGYQSDFARNLTREGRDFADLTAEVVDAHARRRPRSTPPTSTSSTSATRSASCSPARATSARCRPRSNDGLWGTPAIAARGRLRVGQRRRPRGHGRSAAGALRRRPGPRRRAGEDRARRHRRASTSARRPGSATRATTRRSCGRTCSTELADEYDRRYGLDDAHLRAIAAAQLRATPSANPNAQTRDWTVARPLHRRRRRPTRSSRAGSAASTAARSPTAAPGSCSSPTTTCATTPTRRPIGRHRRLGPPHRRPGPAAEARPRRPTTPYVLPHVRRRILDAFGRAAASTLDDLDGIETHDCFTPSEYLAIDHFGITGPGESWKAIEDGEIEIGGRLPINPSGGLIGGGHPVGATGVRMLLDAAKQVSGTRRRLPGRGREDVRHAQLRRQHRDHRQLRRRAESEHDAQPMSRSSASSCPRCPRTTTTRTAPGRGARRPPSGTPTTSTSSRARSRPTSTASTCATPRTRCTRR